MLRKVIYDPETQVKLITEAVQATKWFLDAAFEARHRMDDVTISASRLLAGIFREYVICFKHGAFREENEWRLIYATLDVGDGLKFRTGASFIIPYVELALNLTHTTTKPPEVLPGPIPLKEIVIGPAAHPVLSRRAVTVLLRKHGYRGISLVESRVPLRG